MYIFLLCIEQHTAELSLMNFYHLSGMDSILWQHIQVLVALNQMSTCVSKSHVSAARNCMHSCIICNCAVLAAATSTFKVS